MHTHTCEAYLDIDTGQYPESHERIRITKQIMHISQIS